MDGGIRDKEDTMKITRIALLLFLGILLVSGFACGGDGELAPTPTPTATPTHTPTPTPTPTPIFQLSPLTISPAEAISGQMVSISTTLSNVGGAGTYPAELEINGAVVDAKDVTVPSGGSTTVTFYVTRDEPGTYNVQLGDRRGSFTVAHPPLNVMLDHVGVKYDHNLDGPGDIYLLVLMDDGENEVTYSIPLEGQPGMEISDYNTERVDRSVFTTGSVGDYFKIAVLAYHHIEPGFQGWWIIGTLADYFFGLGGLGTLLGQTIDSINAQAPEYEYVGSYQGLWSDYDSWGIGEHNCVGEDDLRLWFRVWSASPQQTVSHPAVGLPNVVIQNTDIPSEWPVSYWNGLWWTNSRTNTITLRNWESHPVDVRVEKVSSFYPDDVYTWSVTVPAYGTEEIKYKIVYHPEGVRTITVNLFFRNDELDSWSQEVLVTP